MMLIIAFLIIFLNVFAVCGRAWLAENIGLISMDEVIYHFQMPLEGTSEEMIFNIVFHIVIIPLIISIVATFLISRLRGHIDLRFWSKTRSIKLTTAASIFALLFGGAILGKQLVDFNEDYGITDYIASQGINSTFIRDNYIDPANVKLAFPEKKRNLIYIYLESTEATYFSQANGGLQKNSLMPELEKLALENTSFSNTDKLGGAQTVTSTGWTMAGIVAQTAGIPLKLAYDSNKCSTDTCKEFIGGVVALGDILKDNGYNQMFMVGSDMTFGGRRSYLLTHGNQWIRDYYTARDIDHIIPSDHKVYWGMEDSYLFTYAKQELTMLAEKSEPFSFSMLTVNTHFPDGYPEDSCPNTTDDQYSNTILCASTMISDFVSWIKEQPFYENTTVMLIGDHLTMAQNDILGSKDNKNSEDDEPSYVRTVYNAILNSAIQKPDKTITNNRVFTTMDFFPTTLAAIGVKIDGERLGLGTNLYSGTPTLAEDLGIKTLSSELGPRSDFYTNKFLQSQTEL